MLNKIIIIGSGPAGLTAAIYTGRSKLFPIVIDGNLPGGQLMTTTFVENWPGEAKILGPELMMKMRKQAEVYGAKFISDGVKSVDLTKQSYKVYTHGGEVFETESIIIATGSSHRKLGALNEDKYMGKGVTTCATCDGPFYSNKNVVIAGGGNTAVTEAVFMTRFTNKITLIQNLEKLTATDPLKDDVLANKDTKIIYNSVVKEVKGNGEHVTSLIIENSKTKELSEIACDGLFIAVGFKPNSDLFKGQLELDAYGYIKLIKDTETSKAGVFAAGDIADWRYRQAITSAGEGCKAALDCEVYLTKKK